jgi:hypothetical protein
MEMKFWKMNSRRVRGLRALIILGHDKFPTFVVGKKMFFFLLYFQKCNFTLLNVLTHRFNFIPINKNDHLIQIACKFFLDPII